MKQHITLEQVSELTRKGKDKLYKYFFDNAIEPNLLTIGQMIEYLYKNDNHPDTYIDNTGDHCQNNLWKEYSSDKDGEFEFEHSSFWIGWDGELCDKLWRAVKEDLEE